MSKEIRILCWLIFSTILLCKNVAAEKSQDNNSLTISGYLETYYLRDFNRSDNQLRPAFTYSHNQANNPSVNLALVKVSFNDERYRLNLGLGSGSYMRTNYALERDKYQNIFEANVGFKMARDKNLWLDMGVIQSHIGFESAIGVDNWTMTRSMMADNSPYFETGAKLSYTSEDGKWFVSGLLLTGWQRISAPQGNSTPAIGHQLTYKPNERLTLNSSSFIGNDKSDRERQMRYFHNFYAQILLDDRWSLITALDVGAEQKTPQSDDYNVWYTPVVIVRYTLSDNIHLAARYEYFQDKNGVIVATGTPNLFKTHGYSFNLDYQM